MPVPDGSQIANFLQQYIRLNYEKDDDLQDLLAKGARTKYEDGSYVSFIGIGRKLNKIQTEWNQGLDEDEEQEKQAALMNTEMVTISRTLTNNTAFGKRMTQTHIGLAVNRSDGWVGQVIRSAVLVDELKESRRNAFLRRIAKKEGGAAELLRLVKQEADAEAPARKKQPA